MVGQGLWNYPDIQKRSDMNCFTNLFYPSLYQGQLIYMMAMLLIPLIPIFALVTQNVILLNGREFTNFNKP